jgi:ferric-dicitrate binding protein FerR (iron transport regulator)
MKPPTNPPTNPDTALDRAVAAVAGEPVDPSAESAALDRVRRRLAASEARPAAGVPPVEEHRIHGCEGFRALLPAYAAGALAEPKRLLVEDHLRECVPCRRAYRELGASAPRTAGARVVHRAAAGRTARLALAAGLGLFVAGAGALWLTGNLMGPDASASVRTIQGELYRVTGDGAVAAAAGERIARGETVRTGPASGAVFVLADGSRVELAERSELALARRRDGVALELARGSLIVEAARQADGHLYVATADCEVAVVGTIFSVRHGDKGSRVSVLEGEVQVEHGARHAVLRPGDQVSTSERLSHVPVGRDFAWSRDAERYAELSAALAALGRELDQTLAVAGIRTSTRLLDLAPADTAIYAGIPNLSASVAEAWEIVTARVAENPALADWWAERFGAAGADEIDRAIAELTRFGDHLGEEIAVAIDARAVEGPAAGSPSGSAAPLLLAEVDDPAAFAALLDEEIARLNAEHAGAVRVVRVADPRAAVPLPADALGVWLAGDLIAASPRLERLAALAATLDSGENAFVDTSFHDRLAAVYAEGAGWLLGVDLETILAADAEGGHERETLERVGLADVEHLVFESETVADATESRATFAFSRERRGIASWLGAPAPIGAFDFVSPEARVAVAATLKEPTGMLDDILAVAAGEDSGALARIAELEAELGLSIRDDLALSLGGEVAFAIDGPLLPTPGWILVLEVADRERLLAAADRLLVAYNREAAADGRPGLALVQQESGGRVDYALERAGAGAIVTLAFEDGYLLAGPSAAMLGEAVARRAAGVTLASSEAFVQRLPRDGETHYSAVAWQSLGGSLGSIGALLSGGAISPEERERLDAAAAEVGPTLAVAYGGADRLTFATSGGRGPLGLSLETLLSWAARGAPAAPAEEESRQETPAADAA